MHTKIICLVTAVCLVIESAGVTLILYMLKLHEIIRKLHGVCCGSQRSLGGLNFQLVVKCSAQFFGFTRELLYYILDCNINASVWLFLDRHTIV